MSDPHEDLIEEMMDVSLEALSMQANDLSKCPESAAPDDNASIPRHLPAVDSRAKAQGASTDMDTSLHVADDPQRTVDENAETRFHPQHSSERSITFMTLPIEIRGMIMQSIFGGRRVHVRFRKTISSQIEPLRSIFVSPPG